MPAQAFPFHFEYDCAPLSAPVKSNSGFAAIADQVRRVRQEGGNHCHTHVGSWEMTDAERVALFKRLRREVGCKPIRISAGQTAQGVRYGYMLWLGSWPGYALHRLAEALKGLKPDVRGLL